jgi:hypothetical protein
MPANKLFNIVAGLPDNPGSGNTTTGECGVAFDTTEKTLKIFDGTTLFRFGSDNGSVGAKSGSTVSVVEGSPAIHKTTFTLTALPLTLADATVGAGVKIYDFPEGLICILGAYGSVAETTTSILANTLNTGITYNWGVGTTTQANGTLATTEQDIVPTTNGTASATISVAGAASAGVRAAAPALFNGTTTAKSAFFNVGIATNTDIDADATTTWTGSITIVWMLAGDQ